VTERERVEALGRELLSYLPAPRQSSTLLRASTAPGPAPAGRVPCQACQGRGRVRGPGVPCVRCAPRRLPTRGAPPWNTGHGCKPCLGCEGTGWRKARAGEEPVDEYVGPARGDDFEMGLDLATRLEHTNRLLRLWLDPDSVGYRWEEVKERQWKSGSFAELDQALRRLRETHPGRFSLWWRVIVLAEPLELTEAARQAVAQTSDMLAAMMPRPIRVPAWMRPDRRARDRKTSLWRGRTNGHERQRQERNALIRHQAEDLGWSSKKIADWHGLTKQRVNQILAKARAA